MPFTNDHIRQYGIDKGWVNAQGLVNGSTDQERAANALNIYNDATQWGVGADQLEASFGWDAGTVNNYLASLNTGANAGIAPLQDSMAQNDPWAWHAQAQQQDPETYAWRDLGRVEDSPAAYQWMLEKAGIWNPDYVSEADVERYLAAGVDPASISASAGPNPYAGLTMRDARGPGYQRLTQLIDQNGNVIATDNPEAYEGYHEDTWRSAGAIVGGALGGMYLGPAVSGAVGGGTLGAVAGGAATGALTGQIATGDTEGTLSGGVMGGIGGYVGQALNGGNVDPYGPGSGWGQDTLTNMGYSPAEIAAMQSANTIGSGIDYWQSADPYGPSSNWGQDTLTNMGYTPAEIAAMQEYQGGYDEFGPGYNPSREHLTPAAVDSMYNTPGYGRNAAAEGVSGQPSGLNAYPGGYDEFGPGYNPSQEHLTPAAIDSMFNSPGYGSNAAAEGVSGQESGIGALDPDFRPGYVDPGTGSTGGTDSTGGTGYKPQEVSITDTKPPVGTGTGTIPGTNIPPGTGIVPNIPTGQNPPASNTKVPDVPEYRMPNQVAPKSDLEKFWDWAKANPALAMQLFGLGASAFKGGSNNSGQPAPGTGPQAGMTATPAAALNRRYVAPPAGYRPGFDPEWKYFESGPASTGGTGAGTGTGNTGTGNTGTGNTGTGNTGNTGAGAGGTGGTGTTNTGGISTLQPKTYGTNKVPGETIGTFLNQNASNPAAIAVALKNWGVSLNDVVEIAEANGGSRQSVLDYVMNSNNPALKDAMGLQTTNNDSAGAAPKTYGTNKVPGETIGAFLNQNASNPAAIAFALKNWGVSLNDVIEIAEANGGSRQAVIDYIMNSNNPALKDAMGFKTTDGAG